MSANSTLRPTGRHAQAPALSGLIFEIVCFGAIAVGILTLVVLLVDVLYRGLPRLELELPHQLPVAISQPGRHPVGAGRVRSA